MLEVLKFVSSGWGPFLCTVTLIYVVFQGMAAVIAAFAAVRSATQPDHTKTLKRLARSMEPSGGKFKDVPPEDVITFGAKGSDDGLKM